MLAPGLYQALKDYLHQRSDLRTLSNLAHEALADHVDDLGSPEATDLLDLLHGIWDFDAGAISEPALQWQLTALLSNRQ